MNAENGCKWHFGPEGPIDLGPTDFWKGAFEFSTPEINVVREAIQNSLDAKQKDAQGPVNVVFSLSTLPSKDYPEFFGIRKHIEASLDFYKENKRAKEKFPLMIDFLSKPCEAGARPYPDEIFVLTISDSNTTGMPYIKGDRRCAFYAFFQSIGVSDSKPEGAGGSNGLGKNTLFAYSSIRTVLLSSKTLDGSVVFQGRTELCTHLSPDDPDKKVSKFGVYGIDEKEPITDERLIPERFRRNEPGTNVGIVGVDVQDRDKFRNDLVRAVLNHFWLSVRDGLLTVDVMGEIIDKTTLATCIQTYFPEGSGKEGRISNFVRWTPTHYWRAVENAESGLPNTVKEIAELPLIGNVVLYLDWSRPDYPKRIAFMRTPRMVIFKKGKTGYMPFSAVFVCLDKKGNDLLRDTEPPNHASWDAGNYEGAPSDKHIRSNAINEALNFVDLTIEKYLRASASKNEILIPGLAEMLPDGKDGQGESEPGSIGSGGADGLQRSGELAPPNTETAAPVSFIGQDVPSAKLKAPSGAEGSVNGFIEGLARAPEGDPVETFQHPTPGDPNPNPKPGQPSNGKPVEAIVAPQEGKSINMKIKVTSLVGTRRKDGVLWHRIVVRPAASVPEEHCKNVSLALTTGTDNGTQDLTSILAVDGLPSGSFDPETQRICEIDIRGKAVFDVLFEDQIQHSIKVVAHAVVQQ